MADPTSTSQDPLAAKAETILTSLAGIPPQHASAETVQQYDEALKLLANFPGSALWFQACAGLASHLLESPQGDHGENVIRARAVYANMMDHATPERTFDAWMMACSGLANTILFDPAATSNGYAVASEFLDGLLEVARRHANPMQLATLLGQSAGAHSRAQLGDVDSEMERAIQLQTEAVDLLESRNDPGMHAVLGRAQHNLGRFYWNRRTGVRSENVDRAVHALQRALALRPADEDPVGRTRTLRALAVVYPQWSGADSLDHAAELAKHARKEAERLEQSDERERRRAVPRIEIERQQSSLRVDLEWLYELPTDERRRTLASQIENHQNVIQTLDRDAMPTTWAEWMGGLGRLLGRLCHLGVDAEIIERAYECFRQAIDVVRTPDTIRLRRDLLARWGELSHEIGDFETALFAYRSAAEADVQILMDFTAPEHRRLEIKQTRGHALFAAYAAARLGDPAEAARMAELECNRGLAELMSARIVLSSASAERKTEVKACVAKIRALQTTLRNLGTGDVDIEEIHRRLADYLCVDPSVVQMRRIDPGAYDADSRAAERLRLGNEIGAERHKLRALVALSDAAAIGTSLSFRVEDIGSIPGPTDTPLVYLMATVHGGMGVVVLPAGGIELLPLETLTSDAVSALLEGTEEFSGFLTAKESEREDTLDACLTAIETALRPTLMDPLVNFLRERSAQRATVIGLGKLGVLPLHIASSPDLPLAHAPSAKAIASISPDSDRALDGPMLVVADPTRDDLEPLRFAVAEGRRIAQLARTRGEVDILVSDGVTLADVASAVPHSALVHFACHGLFRPADPLASHLSLTGKEELTLATIFAGEVNPACARVVTLSACETGGVEMRHSPDEAIGFPTALMMAGVPAVVGSMWPVDDAATMFFMVRLYESLLVDKLGILEAVAETREWLKRASVAELQELINQLRSALKLGDDAVDAELAKLAGDLASDGDPPFVRPSDWGAFFLTGR